MTPGSRTSFRFFDGQVLTLLVNIEFIRNMLRNNYDQLIQAALMQAAGEPVRYVVRIRRR